PAQAEENPWQPPRTSESRAFSAAAPIFELLSQGAEASSREKVLELRCGSRHSARNLVAADTCEQNAVSLCGQAFGHLRRGSAIVAGSRHKAFFWRFNAGLSSG